MNWKDVTLEQWLKAMKEAVDGKWNKVPGEGEWGEWWVKVGRVADMCSVCNLFILGEGTHGGCPLKDTPNQVCAKEYMGCSTAFDVESYPSFVTAFIAMRERLQALTSEDAYHTWRAGLLKGEEVMSRDGKFKLRYTGEYREYKLDAVEDDEGRHSEWHISKCDGKGSYNTHDPADGKKFYILTRAEEPVKNQHLHDAKSYIDPQSVEPVKEKPKHKDTHHAGERYTHTNATHLRGHNLPCPCTFEFVRKDTQTHRGEAFWYGGDIDFSGYSGSGWKFRNAVWVLRPINKLSRTTVLTFDRNGKQGSYSFKGEPDWPRIEREMLADGLMAVIVKGKSVHWSKGSTMIFDTKIKNFYDGMGWCEDRLPQGSRGWNLDTSEIGSYTSEIIAAIEKWRETEKPEHYDGEECRLPLVDSEYVRTNLAKRQLVYTGEYRDPTYGEFFVQENGMVCWRHKDTGWLLGPRWILRAVPDKKEPQWKDGDWAFDKDFGIVMITKISGSIAAIQMLDGRTGNTYCVDLRPLTPQDWTRTIGGVKVRAYEDRDGDVLFYTEDTWDFLSCMQSIVRELCCLVGIPIMPYSLSKGNYKTPE